MMETSIAALITAFAAIVAPVITSLINSRTSLRLKSMELTETGLNTIVSNFVMSYVKMKDTADYETYWSFMSAAYQLIARVGIPEIQQEILSLLDTLKELNRKADENTDNMFDGIMFLLSKHLKSN